MTALPPDLVADLERENARLQAELRAARERQLASAEILRTIASTPGDAEQSLQQIAETTARLFGAPSVTVLTADGNEWGKTIRVGDGSKRIGSKVSAEQLRIGGPNLPGTVVSENRQIHIPDLDNIDATMADWPGPPLARAAGTRVIAGTPLRREGRAIGALIVFRDRPLPFTAEELALQQSFADQAVIAIENARLFNETKEALERQTATADILKVIASSPSNAQPVFDVIVERAVRLCGGRMGRVYRYEDGIIHMVAGHGLNEPGLNKVQQVFPRAAADDTTAGRAIQSRRPNFVIDIKTDESVPALSRQMIEALGTRSQVTVPMLRSGAPIGAITVGWADPGAYSDQQVALLQTFADQAVIAIENVRLFNETREALERQTATADILKVIASSPSDVQPVFAAIATSSNRLIGGFSTAVFRFVDGIAQLAAFTPTVPAADEHLKAQFPRPLSDFHPFEMAQTGQIVQIADTESSPDPRIKTIARVRGFRSMLFAPLMNSGVPIGLISVTRLQPGSFASHHIQLLQTFADQAVIAIENVRLFNEVQAKTYDLSESLQQQTATADVLKVISRSAFDLDAVMDTLARSAAELCDADFSGLFFRDGDFLALRGMSDVEGRVTDFLRQARVPIDDQSHMGRAILNGTVANVSDFDSDTTTRVRTFREALGFRAMLIVPMMREGRGIGVFGLCRNQVGAFSQRQIELVQTFADQAVIAIENTRLFNEVQARTRELSVSLDELRTAQDRLVQTEKLASLGQLTAGIAHEIKNPLNFVNNFAALSAELTDELKDVLASASLTGKIREEVAELTQMLKDNLERVVQHGKRADSIVKNMLLHSREGSGEHRPADINALLDESLNLAYHGARAEKPQFNVTLRRDFDQMAGMIELFPQEITRVLLNLISNGFYAVTKRKAENGGSAFEPMLSAATRDLGDTVEIRIRDNGIGIPADVKEKMFNPFFTTKPAGEGTGLGLSMSHDIIVKQHGGSIDVETEPGEFTEFRIVLPRTSRLSDKERG